MFLPIFVFFGFILSTCLSSYAANNPVVVSPPTPISIAKNGGTGSINLKNSFALADARGPICRFDTSVGFMDVELFSDATPLTVANFRKYLSAKIYNDTFIHRAIPGFIVQGGGYKIAQDLPHIQSFAAVKNEFQRFNLPGTVAMAKLGGDPDSATSEWFFNIADNASNLDNQNGGFTVFGKILGNGLAKAIQIAGLPILNIGGAFTDCPFTDGKATYGSLVALKTVSEIPLMPEGNSTPSYLKLSATSSNPALLKVTINGSLLQLQSIGNTVGQVDVTITAIDPEQQKASVSLKVNIINPAAPVLNIASINSSITESSVERPAIRISRSGSTSLPLNVSLSFSGSATNGVDVQSLPAKVTIPAGKPSIDLPVVPINDSKSEGLEKLVVKINNTPTQQPGSSAEGEIIILDDEVPTVTLVPVTPIATEGSEAKIRLSRTGSTSQPLRLTLQFSGAGAAQLGWGNLTSATIPAGNATTEIRLPVNYNLPGSQTIQIALAPTTLANIPSKPVDLTLFDKDCPTVSLEVIDASASEPGADKARVRIRRTGSTAAPLTTYISTSGNALSGVDYTALPSSVTIPAGSDSAFIDIIAKDDNLKEGQEKIVINVEKSTYYNAQPNSVNILLNDND